MYKTVYGRWETYQLVTKMWRVLMEEHFYEHYSKGDLKLQEAERTLTGTRVVFLIESDRDSCKI